MSQSVIYHRYLGDFYNHGTMILYLNYKNNVYKIENLNKKSGRWSKILKNFTT